MAGNRVCTRRQRGRVNVRGGGITAHLASARSPGVSHMFLRVQVGCASGDCYWASREYLAWAGRTAEIHGRRRRQAAKGEQRATLQSEPSDFGGGNRRRW